jgi:hypothetical protein
MKTVSVSILVVLVAGLTGCGNKEIFVLDPGSTQNGDLDGDMSCENGTEDLETVEECVRDLGWPCACSNTAECDNGTECIGPPEGGGYDSGAVGMCAPKCPMEETEVPFGMAVVEVCGTCLAEDDCFPVLSGCESNDDCPEMLMCVEPSCIAYEPGCDEGAGEKKVCFPDNL